MQPSTNALSIAGVLPKNNLANAGLNPVTQNPLFDPETQSRITAATQAGIDPKQIIQEATAYQLQKNNQQAAAANNPIISKNTLASILPIAGGIIGGGLGAFLGPEGAIAGGALGQGLGETGKEAVLGQQLNPGQIALQGALGLSGGVAGEVLSKVGGAALSKVGEGIATDGLNFTPRMVAQYTADHGEAPVDTLLANKLAGAGADQIQTKGIDPLMEQFNAIGKSSATLDPNLLNSNMADVVQKLATSSVPSQRGLAQKVTDAFGNTIDKFGNKPITLADLNAERAAFDKATPDTAFGSEDRNVNQIVGATYRKTMQQAADAAGLVGKDGQSFQQIGSNMNKLIDLHDMAIKRVGTGESPFSLSSLMTEGAGGIGGAAIGINPLIGAAGMYGSNLALKSPLIAGILSKGAMAAGKKVSGNVLPITLAGVLGGAGLGQTIANNGSAVEPFSPMNKSNESTQTNDSNYNPENSNSNIQQHTNIIPQSGNGVSVDSQGNYQLPTLDSKNPVPQQISLNDYLNALQKAPNNPAIIEKINAAYQASQDQAKQQISQFALDPDQRQFMETAQNTNKMMNELRGLISKTGTSPINGIIPGLDQIKSQTDPNYAKMKTIMASLKGQAVKAIEGGRPSNFDLQVFNNAPAATDTPQVAIAKLNNIQSILANQYMQSLPAYQMTLSQ